MEAQSALVVLIGILLVIGVFSVLWSGSTAEEPNDQYRTAKVLRIIDGDTVVVSTGWRQLTIRLDAIDCPEKDQPWGDTAKYGLIKLIGGRKIRYDTHGLDNYGRTLATIHVQQKSDEQWTNVNSRMVVLGHAWVSRPLCQHLSKDKQRELFQMQRWARSKRVGLWKTPNPIPPWQWRNGGKSAQDNVFALRRK